MPTVRQRRCDTIAVDIDGVLTNETYGPYSKRTPNRAAISLLKVLSRYCKVVLFTARYKVDEEATRSWLTCYNVPFAQLVMGKLHYQAIVDDKAVWTE